MELELLSEKALPIQDTYAFKLFKVGEQLQKVNKNHEEISKKELDAILYGLKYHLKVFGQQRYIDYVMNGTIRFTRAATIIPAWSAQENGKIVTYVNINRYAILDEKGEVKSNINIRSIAGMMAVGIVQNIMLTKPTTLTTNIHLRAAAMNCYNRIIVRNLDMLFAISASPVYNKAISFLVNKYFLVALYGLPKDAPNLDNAAFNDGSKNISVTFESVKALLDRSNFNNDVLEKSFDEFIMELIRVFPMLKGLSPLSFVRNMIIKLGELAPFILESYTYVLGVMLSVSLAANIVRDIRFTSIIDSNNINKLASQVMSHA